MTLNFFAFGVDLINIYRVTN